MPEKKTSLMFRIIVFLVRLFYPKMEVVGAENLPEEPAIIVGNHSQMNGPIACELYSPRRRWTWCAGEMMHWKEVHGYAYRDFWSGKPKAVRWLFYLASWAITPLAVCLFNNANTIPVYHDNRIMTTFRQTMDVLDGGADVVIFPEHDAPGNHILYAFQERFVDVARLYCRRAGRALDFVPLYLCPQLHKMIYGKPVRYDPAAPAAEERQRICRVLTEEITALALELPPHTVVPYRNIPKKDYPRSRPA